MDPAGAGAGATAFSWPQPDPSHLAASYCNQPPPSYYHQPTQAALAPAPLPALPYPGGYHQPDSSSSSLSYFYYQNPNGGFLPPLTSTAMAGACVGYGAGYSYATERTVAETAGGGLVSASASAKPSGGRQFGFDPQLYVQAIAEKSSIGVTPVEVFEHWNLQHGLLKHGIGEQVKRKKLAVHPFCEVCKISCTSAELLMTHKTGKKHKANLAKLQDAITPKQSMPAIVVDTMVDSSTGAAASLDKNLESKRHKLLEVGAANLKLCTVCNVVANSQSAYEAHLAGSKHAAMVKKLQDPSNSLPSSIMPASGELEVKKQKVLEAGAAVNDMRVCTVCNVVVNSEKVYLIHAASPKHAAMAKKLSDQNTAGFSLNQPSTVKAAAGMSTANPVVTANSEDIEMKKRKLIEAGVSPLEVRVCLLCNVVLNGQKTFDDHLASSKHQRRAGEGINIAGETATANPAAVALSVSEDIEAKKRRVLAAGTAPHEMRICYVCNVVTNSQRVFDAHMGGSKHASAVRMRQQLLA